MPPNRRKRPKRSYSSAATADDAQSTEGIEFEVDGVEFTCHGRISAFDLAAFAGPVDDAGVGAENADPAVLRILADFLMAVMGPVTYREFTDHRRRHHTPDSVVQQILFDIIEDSSDRPTSAPSPSPAGQPTPATAPAASPSPESAPAVVALPGLDPALDQSAAGWPDEDLAELARLGDLSFAEAPAPGTEPPPPGPRRNVTLNFSHPERTRVETEAEEG